MKQYAPQDQAVNFMGFEGSSAEITVEALRRAGLNPTRKRVTDALKSWASRPRRRVRELRPEGATRVAGVDLNDHQLGGKPLHLTQPRLGRRRLRLANTRRSVRARGRRSRPTGSEWPRPAPARRRPDQQGGGPIRCSSALDFRAAGRVRRGIRAAGLSHVIPDSRRNGESCAT
jgi:hypothetical protein